MKPKKCPYCKGSGVGHDHVREFQCWFCDGFGFVDEFTIPKVIKQRDIKELEND